MKAADAAGVAKQDLLTVRVTVSRTTVKVGKKRRTAFRAEQALQITVRNIAALGGLLDAVADAGADIDGPDFGFADPSQGRLLATRAALADARARADDAAAQAGLRITGVRSIVLDPQSDFSGELGLLEREAALRPAARAATRSSPARRSSTKQVRVVYTGGAGHLARHEQQGGRDRAAARLELLDALRGRLRSRPPETSEVEPPPSRFIAVSQPSAPSASASSSSVSPASSRERPSQATA